MSREEEKVRRFDRLYSLVLHLAGAAALWLAAGQEEWRWGSAGMFALVAVALWERRQQHEQALDDIRRLKDELSTANEKAAKLDELLRPPF